MREAHTKHTCVILAAGAGSRIAALKAERPKSLLPIANKPLIGHQLEMLAGLGVSRVILVSNSTTLETTARELASPSIELIFIEQKAAEGISHSLAFLEDRLDEPFMALLGDTFIHAPTLAPALSAFAASPAEAFVFIRAHSTPEEISAGFAVVADAFGRVLRVVEKPTRRISDTRGCGVYLFRPSIFDAIRKTARSPLRNEYELTDAIQTLIDSGALALVASPGKWDMNINTPEDLLLCNLLLADTAGKSIISASAQIHPGAVISRSVIGPGASILNPIQIRNSLVAENVCLDSSGPIENTLIFPSGIYVCPPDTI
ncbi:MAG: sugar phosphate nucleotidyltransferase [bacterium]